MSIAIYFFPIILIHIFQPSNQECAAYTGNIISNPTMESFILFPWLYYSNIGKEVVDKIRNEICSTTEEKLDDLSSTPWYRNVSEKFFSGYHISCYMVVKYNNTLSLGGIRGKLSPGIDSIKKEFLDIFCSGFICEIFAKKYLIVSRFIMTKISFYVDLILEISGR